MAVGTGRLLSRPGQHAAGSWILQDSLLSGWSSTEAYLPARKIAIAVAATFDPAAFNSAGVEPSAADPIFRSIGAYLAPGDPPPTKKSPTTSRG